jgi:hypothetical protein
MIERILISLIVILTSCQSRTERKEIISSPNIKDTISGRYLDRSGYCQLSFTVKSDSLLGTHCFVTKDGGKIDCCTIKEMITLRLKHKNPNSFEGRILSCYDDQFHKILITQYGDSVEFIFIKSDHPFLRDTLYFHKDKS